MIAEYEHHYIDFGKFLIKKFGQCIFLSMDIGAYTFD